MGSRRPLSHARRVVVKVGSGLVTTAGEGPSSEHIGRLATDISALVHDRHEVALVTSGAIATGMARLGLKAMIGGALASYMVASVAGAFYSGTSMLGVK